MPFDGIGSDSIANALKQTRRLIVERGWCQRIAQDPAGRLCLFGAIREATHGQDGNPLYVAAYDHVTILIGEIARWNDAPGRTEAEVLALLDRAIL